MRRVQFMFGFAGFALMLAAGQAALGQGGVVMGSIGVGGGMGPRGVTGAPYTAVRKTTHVQKLANGTTITRENSVKEARDSYGRTYRESRPEFHGDADGQQRDFVFVNVSDPVNYLMINWNSNTKQATVMHLPEPGQELPHAPRVSADPTVAPVTPPTRMVQTRPEIEKLGTKTINGVEAEGTRITRVIPAGREGNDQPLTIVSETWTSPELRLTVLSTNDDPRNGSSTTELTDIDRNEPDPSLFQVPEGYAVKDQYPHMQN